MNRFSVFAATIAALFSLSAIAGVYRWVDAEGHVHYTDKPVENSEPVNVHTGQTRSSELGDGINMNSNGSGNAPPEQVAQKKSDCEQKKKQYESYKTAGKIVETDGLGRKHEYSADEMKQLVEHTQKAMEETCGAAGSSVTATP